MRRRSRGQSLVEFALVAPVLLAVVGGMVQFGMIFWGQITLTQVVRDTGRWASTQQQCSSAAVVQNEGDSIALASALFGYTSGEFKATGSSPMSVSWADVTPTPPGRTGDICPPPNNAQVWQVTITGTHSIPVFFPGMQYLPGFANNRVTLSSQAVFRMEPAP
jgi:Flp pilus assembly protein TadG